MSAIYLSPLVYDSCGCCSCSVFYFALGCCLFSSGFSSRLPLGATRVVEGTLVAPIGSDLGLFKSFLRFCKCRTRVILYEFTTSPESPAISHLFPPFILFAYTLGSARLRGWRQCCLGSMLLIIILLPLGVEEGTHDPAHLSYLVGCVLRVSG